jgi:hypothetical protein
MEYSHRTNKAQHSSWSVVLKMFYLLLYYKLIAKIVMKKKKKLDDIYTYVHVKQIENSLFYNQFYKSEKKDDKNNH